MRIEGIATANENLFATADIDRTVRLWSLTNRAKVKEFPTIFDFGGSRLALASGAQNVVVSGSWSTGIEAYDCATGKVFWGRRDLKNVQQIVAFSRAENPVVAVALEDEALSILTAETGRNLLRISSTRGMFASNFGEFCLLVTREDVQLSNLESSAIWRKPLNSFAVLHATFSKDLVAFSEAGGPVRAYDFFGEEAWRFNPKKGWHVTRIGWDSDASCWRAINRHYEGDGASVLLELSNRGNAREVSHLGHIAHAAFFPEGQSLVTSAGEVISGGSGESVWKFLSDC